MHLQIALGQEPFQPGILGRQFFRALDVTCVRAAVRASPAVKRLLDNAMLAVPVQQVARISENMSGDAAAKFSVCARLASTAGCRRGRRTIIVELVS